MLQEIRHDVRHLVSVYNASALELERDINIMRQKTRELKKRLADVNELLAALFRTTHQNEQTPTAAPKTSYCSGKIQRLSGPTVDANLKYAPNGTLCIGNSVSPSPNNNFLVFRKNDSKTHFLGTESLLGGFTDFTPYVNWDIDTFCSRLSGCNSLPASYRGNLTGPSVGCSQSDPNGFVYLVCGTYHDAVVDNNGAITVMYTDNETLWYWRFWTRDSNSPIPVTVCSFPNARCILYRDKL